jgi:hypothetical protein
MRTAPPVPVAELDTPTATSMSPELPCADDPVDSTSDPDVPAPAGPVDTLTDPLLPTAPPAALPTDTLPLEAPVLTPITNVTPPLTPSTLEPPTRLTSPP